MISLRFCANVSSLDVTFLCVSSMIGGWTRLFDQAETALPKGARRHGAQRPAGTGEPQHLFEVVRSWSSLGERTLHLDGKDLRKERDAHLKVSWGTLRLWPPDGEAGKEESPLVVTVVRTWEPDPPQGEEALEWLLLTSVSVENEEQAWERVEWYRMRWIVEDYHQCLKTGCQIEARHVQTYEGLRTVLGFLAPLAVRLLQLRSAARAQPDQPAQDVLPKEVVQVVAHLAHVAPSRRARAKMLAPYCPSWRLLGAQGGRRTRMENPSFRAGCTSRPCLRVSIWLLNSRSNRTLWGKDRAEPWSLREHASWFYIEKHTSPGMAMCAFIFVY